MSKNNTVIIPSRYVWYRISNTDCRTVLERLAHRGLVSFQQVFPFESELKRSLPGRENPESKRIHGIVRRRCRTSTFRV